MLLAGVWVLAFAVLPHHHDPSSGMPCLDLHHHHQHAPSHDDCCFGRAFVIEFQREDDYVHFIHAHAQLLPDLLPGERVTQDFYGWTIESKPYTFVLNVSDCINVSTGRAPPVV